MAKAVVDEQSHLVLRRCTVTLEERLTGCWSAVVIGHVFCSLTKRAYVRKMSKKTNAGRLM